jgi:hypothetical protein
MTAPADTTREVAREVAARNGLPERAITLLPTDGTVEEIEHAAAQLAALVEKHGREQQPEPEPAPDILTSARLAKQERQQQLIALFSGCPQPQPRDPATGRFSSSRSRSTGFDLGARRTVPPARPDPLRAHDELIVDVGRLAAFFRGAV